MIPRCKLSLLGSATLLAAAAAISAAEAPTTAPAQKGATDLTALQAEVTQLRSEVKALKDQLQLQAPQKTQPDPTQATTIDALARESDRRSQMLDLTGATAGWSEDRGFSIRTDDGNFVLSPFMLLQVRDATTWRQDEKARGSDDTQNGFEIRRLQLGFDGNAFSPDFTYRIFWQSSEITTGNLSLLMAWFQYRIHDTPWVIGGGQFKNPLDHEQLLSDATQLASDRTFVDDILANGEAFSKGLTIRYDNGGAFRGEAAFTSGMNNNNDNFEGFPTNPSTFGMAARADYKLMGRWKDYEQFTSQGNKEDLFVVGGGVDWTEAGHTNAFRHVIDAQYNPGPLGLYASYLGRYTSGNTAGRGGDTYDPSIRVQASYMVNTQWEGFGRYDWVHFDGKEFKAGTQSNVQEFTAGANYYFHGQRARLTFDLSYLPKGTPTVDIGNDILVNPGHGELIFRGQFQLQL